MEEQKKLCDQMDQIDDVNQPDMVRYLYHPGSIHLSFRVQNAMEPIQYDIEVQCDICQQMFGSKEDLDRHKVTMTSQRNHRLPPFRPSCGKPE